MSNIVVFAPAGVPVTAHEGDPPVDQSALVAQLQEAVEVLTSQRNLAVAEAAGLRAKIETFVTGLSPLVAALQA